MAFRTWGRPLLTALGVSLLAGAGQLGIAFGFGIVRLTGTFTGATVNQWPAQLVWAGWFAANAAVVGAVLTERLARRDGGLAGNGRLLAVAGAAALGATVVAPLCMQPARAAELFSVDPVWAVGICAVLGALAGAGAALAVLLQPPVGWNMAAVAGAIWLLALVSVAPSLVSTGPLETVRLGVLEPASLDTGAAQRLALVVLPLLALLAGTATGGLARWRGHPPLVSGATGVAGPVLVAFAYLAAGPGDTADRYQLTPYYAALLAVAAGALGSAAAALLRWPLVARTAPTGAIEPTDILRPLPTGPALPQAPAATGDDEPETADLSGAALVVADATGGTGPGAVTAAGDGAAPRVVPAHWDWPAGGGTVPAPPADARADADRQSSTGSPAEAPSAAERPVEPEPARPRDGAAGQTSTAPTTSATAEPSPAAEAAPAGQPAEVDDEQPAVPSAPKPRRTRKPRSPRKVAAAVAPEGADPTPLTADQTPVAADPTPVAADPTPVSGATAPAPQAEPDPPVAATDLFGTTAARTGTTAANSTTPTPAPAWPAPPRTQAGAAEAAQPGTDPGSEPTLRPRHRAPMPDLTRAANWEALATARRGGPVPAAAPENGTPATGVQAAPGSTSPAGDEQPTGRGRGPLGLFRRNRSRVEDAPTDRESEPLPAQDEEYVDWVTGLSRPVADNEPEQDSGRRSLRSTGRHHRD
ncbi:hypothetical protein KBX06_02535 [Micromonospora sp. C31]|uniref:hypothetical protein n=1 Tax=Micromonospora sp. C31 TaxID=2824876 RepID=UPI001B35FDF9|nr:hypothetical protein [Micromonospora sp. C31]MBQ1072050.1 hypothetical protein [Micromonospora sp. C31]